MNKMVKFIVGGSIALIALGLGFVAGGAMPAFGAWSTPVYASVFLLVGEGISTMAGA